MVFPIRVRTHERALVFVHNELRAVFGPGVHRWAGSLFYKVRRVLRVEIVSTLEAEFEHPELEALAKHPMLEDELEVVNLGAMQRAVVWKDGRVLRVLGQGLYAFWKSAGVCVETFDAEALTFQHAKAAVVLAHADAKALLDSVTVEPHVAVLWYVDGALRGRLATGRHAFWKNVASVRAVQADLREQVADVAGQEIMTSDKVSLRVNLLVTYQVTDPVKAVTVVSDASQALYRESQLALRAAVGTRSLDQLLSDKEAVGSMVREAITSRASEFGITVRSVGLKDIVLPGDMKAILNQVIEAEKRAQAESIKRREETAAARSQANTAKLLAENPALARLKELEALQEILKGTTATFVLGPGDVYQQVRSLVAGSPA